MLDLTTISLDQKAGGEGQWFPFYSGAELKIASSDHPQYRGYLAKLAKSHRVDLDDANPGQFQAVQNITCEALAKFVLLGWKGISVGDKAVPYSPELGAQALKESPKLMEFVTDKAGNIEHFHQKEVETAKKS